MIALGITATSGRHGRSCEGWMNVQPTATTTNSPAKAQDMCRRLVSHKAQTLNARNAAASATRSHGHGRLE